MHVHTYAATYVHVCNYSNLNFVACIITEQNCTAENQVYTLDTTDCIPTCSNPNPPCSRTSQGGCTCPNGTVLDENQNKCVPPSKCSKNI